MVASCCACSDAARSVPPTNNVGASAMRKPMGCSSRENGVACAGWSRCDVIDVGRGNTGQPTGVIRLAMSNRAQFPDPLIHGKAYPLRSGARPAGLIFFNDLGDEDGGLIWSGKRVGNGYEAGASLTM